MNELRDSADLSMVDLYETLKARVGRGLEGLVTGSDPASCVVDELLLAGGKRLRGALVHLGGLVAGADPGQLDALAVAAELVHVASLLHDDVMDGARVRRGRTAAWVSVGPRVAVLGGDLAHVLALQRVRRAPDPVLPRFLDTVATMVRAQSLEVRHERSLAGGVGAWREVAFGKTAALAGWCAEAGALVTGEAVIAHHLRQYGEELGLAFQAVDDMLDLVPGGDPTKPALADLRAGVPSLPIRFAAARDAAVGAELRALWRTEGDPSSALVEAVWRAGAVPALEWVEGSLGAARSALDRCPEHPARAVLAGLLDALSTRACACVPPSQLQERIPCPTP